MSGTLNYDGFAETYDALVRRGGVSKVYECIVEEMVAGTELRGSDICDLGCGQGELACRLQQLGANVTGVDVSQAMLDLAATRTAQVRWLQDDAMTLRSVSDESFDIVVSSVMLMDVPDHRAVFDQGWRILREGGCMIWLIMHPCFQSPFSHPLDDGSRRVYRYAPQFWKSHGTGTLRSTLGAYHRPVSWYMNDFLRAGFVLDKVLEPGCETAFRSVIHYFGAVGRKRLPGSASSAH